MAVAGDAGDAIVVVMEHESSKTGPDHRSSGHTVWWNGSIWCWHAWINGTSGTGTQDWPLEAELRAIEWIGQQGRDPLSKVLEDVHRLRAENPGFYGGGER